MKILILKYGASGDVIRTTTLLNVLEGDVDWITTDMNSLLLQGNKRIKNIIKSSEVDNFNFPKYDLVINLEDSKGEAELLRRIEYEDLFGAYLDKNDKMKYTDNSAGWFDLSLISKYGLSEANRLKYKNNHSFQQLIFEGLGFKFNNEPYFLPETPISNLIGDVAISPKAGKVWPSKNWAYYEELVEILSRLGYEVNILPQRATMLEHLADVRNHKLLISGDSLPMHFALGSNISCITLFICTSPTEIYDYNIQQKIVSPKLEEYFYKRDFIEEAVKSIPIEEVLESINFKLSNEISNAI